MPGKVTDPALLDELEGGSQQPVSDPGLLAQLERPDSTPPDSTPPEVQELRGTAAALEAKRSIAAVPGSRTPFAPTEEEQRAAAQVALGGDTERRAAYLRWQAQHSELTSEDAARAVRAAAATGMPVGLVAKDLPTFERQMKAQGIDFDALANEHPALADFLLEDPARFALVKDQAADFTGIDRAIGRWGRVPVSELVKRNDYTVEELERMQADPSASVVRWTRPVWMDMIGRGATKDVLLNLRQTSESRMAAAAARPAPAWWEAKLFSDETYRESPLFFGPGQERRRAAATADDLRRQARMIATAPEFFDPTGQLGQGIRERLANLPPSSEEERLANLAALEQLSTEVTGARNYGAFSLTVLGRAVYAPAKMSRILVGNVAAGLGAGPAGVALYNFAEFYGPTTYQMQQTTGPDGKAVDPGTAQGLGLLSAGGQAALFMVPMSRIVARLPGASTFVEASMVGAGERLLLSRTGSQILLDAAREGGIDYASGVAAMSLAAGYNRLLLNVGARSVQPGLRLWDGVGDDTFEAAHTALIEMAPLVVIPGFVSLAKDLGRQRAAQKSALDIQALHEQGAKAEELVAAAPADARRLFQAMVDAGGTGVTDHVYVDIQSFQRYAQKAKVDPHQLAFEILGDGKAYDKAVAEHADRLAIPTADFLTKLAVGEGAKHGAALLPDLATGADVPTPRQAQAEAKRRAERFEELKTAAPEKIEADQARVYSAYRDQALAAGEGEKVADANGRIYSAALQTLAERAGRGKSAWDLWQANVLQIMRGETPAMATAAQGQRLEQAGLQAGLPEASRILTERFHQMTPEERSAEHFIDRNTGILNARAFKHLPADPERPLVGHISVEGTKWVQDHPQTGHAAGDLLYRMAGKALHEVAPEAAKVGGDFAVRVEDQADLDRIVAAMNERMPVKGYTATGRVGETLEAAGKAHVELKKAGEDATPPTRAKRGERPFGVQAESPAAVKLPEERAAATVPAELARQHAGLAAEEAFRATYVEPSGVLTSEGWNGIPRKAHQVAIDLNGLKFFNEKLGNPGGDALLRVFAVHAREAGGADFDFAHLHGDEYAAQSHDRASLEAFIAKLERVSDDVRVDVDAPDGITYEVQGLQFGRGLGGSNAEAEAGLAAHKLELSAAGKRGAEADARRLRPLSAEEAAARNREDQSAREDRLVEGRGAAPAGRGRAQDYGGAPGEEVAPAQLRQGSRITSIEGEPARFRKEGERGYIDIRPARPGAGEPVRFDLHLLAGDRSTLAHETFHALSVLLGQLATREGAPEPLRADYQRLLDAMGYKDHAERQAAPDAAKEEKAAHLWEMYLGEGRAPSAALLTAFARFRAWLGRIYRGALGIREQYRKQYGQDLELSDDVRQLFGRLLAGDEAVANAAREVRFEAPEVKLTPEEQAQSDQLQAEARARAELELQRQLVAEERSTDREFMKEARAKVETDVAARLEAEDPLFRAQSSLERGDVGGLPAKLDAGAVREELGPEVLRGLPKGYAAEKDGLPPDALADLLGFDSGAELVRQLVNAEPRAERLRRETSTRMAELYPRLQDRPQVLRDAARDALGNDALLKDGLLRLRALEREAGLPPTRSSVADIRAAAAEAVDGKTIAELQPGRFDAAARAFARKASDLQNAEARRDAFEAYVFNQALAQAARGARARAEKTARFLQRFTTDAKRGKLGQATEEGPDGAISQPYLDQVDELLGAFEFRASATLKDVRSRATQRAALEKWAAERWADGDSVIIPPSVLENLGRAKHWKDLTPGELEDLRSAVESIAKQADRRTKYRVGGEEVATERVVLGLQAAALKNGAHVDTGNRLPRLRDRIAELKRQGKHAVEYLEIVFDELDGFDPDGPWKKFIWGPISDASYRFYDLVRKTSDPVQKLLEGLSPAERQRLKRTRFEVDGREYSLENALVALANAGNESNESKMVRGMSDPRVAEAFNRIPWFGRGTLDKILAHLEGQDAKLIGKIHEVLDSLRPEMEKLEKEDTGIAPGWIQAKRRRFVGADGKEHEIAGGYYPMLYEHATRVGKTQGEAETAAANGLPGLFQPGYERVVTPGGHLEERVENFARPIDLTFNRLPSKLTASAKDIAFRLPAKQAYRVLMDERIAGALTQALGEKGHDLVMGWLRDSVNDVMLPDVGAGIFTRFMQWSKGQTYRSIFGFNIGQAAQNLADLIVALPQKRMADAALKLVRDIPGERAKILAESGEMRLRADGWGRLSQDLRSTFKRSETALLWEKFGDIGMLPFEMTNQASEFTVYLGSKLHALDQGMDQAQAVRHAEAIVRQTFGGRRTVDLTPIQRDKVFRHLTMFWGWAGANLNQWIRARAASGKLWNDGMKGLALRTLARTFVAISTKMVLSELFTGKGPRDDDKDGLDAGDVGRWVAFRSVMAVPSTFPIVGSGVRTLAGGEPPRDLSLTPWTNLLSASFKALSATRSAVMAPDELEAEQEVNLFLAWVEAGGQFAGAPVTQARATARYWLRRPEGATPATDVLGSVFGPDREGKLSHLTVDE